MQVFATAERTPPACRPAVPSPPRVNVQLKRHPHSSPPASVSLQTSRSKHTYTHTTTNRPEPPASITRKHSNTSLYFHERQRLGNIFLGWNNILSFSLYNSYKNKKLKLFHSRLHLSYLLHLHRGSGYMREGERRESREEVSKRIWKNWINVYKMVPFSITRGLYFSFFLSKNKI